MDRERAINRLRERRFEMRRDEAEEIVDAILALSDCYGGRGPDVSAESCIEWWSDRDGTMHARIILTPAWQRRVGRRVWWLLEEAGDLLMAAFREAGLELKQPSPMPPLRGDDT